MKLYHITLALLLSLLTTALYSHETNTSCLLLNEQNPIKNTRSKIFLLLNSAFIDNACPVNKRLLIHKIIKTKINGITILHNSSENITSIALINELNTNLLKKHLKNYNKGKMEANFSKASLAAFTDIINSTCKLNIKLTNSKNKKFTLVSQKQISKRQFCLNSATILAGYNVKLKYVNGVFYESVKK